MKQMRRGKICRVAEESWGGGAALAAFCAHANLSEHTHECACTHTGELSMSLPHDFSVDRSFASLSFQANLRTSMSMYSMCECVSKVCK